MTCACIGFSCRRKTRGVSHVAQILKNGALGCYVPRAPCVYARALISRGELTIETTAAVAAEAAAVAATTVVTAAAEATAATTVAAEAATATAVATTTIVTATKAATATTVAAAVTVAKAAAATTVAAKAATATAEAHAGSTVAAVAAVAATTIIAAATRTTVVVQAHLDQRIDNLIKQSKQLLDAIGRNLRNELLALLGLSSDQLLGILARHNNDLAHIGLFGLDTSNDVELLGLGKNGVEVAKAHAHELSHLLLLHLGLELQELKGTLQIATAIGLGLGLLSQSTATVTQQASSTVHLIKQFVIQILGSSLALGSLDDLVILSNLSVLGNLSVGRGGLNICILSRSNLGLNLSLLDHIHRLVQFHVLVLGHVSPPAL